MAKEECQLCHNMVKGPLHSKDGICVCFDCIKIVAANANIRMIKFSAYLWTFDELRKMYHQKSTAEKIAVEENDRRNKLETEIQEAQKTSEILEASGVRFSHFQKALAIPKPNILFLDMYDTYSYSDIVKFEYFEDAKLITEGGAGKAIVGGLLFGTVGAVVGSSGSKTTSRRVDKQEVHITMRKPGSSTIKIYQVDVAPAFGYSKEKAEKLLLLLQEAVDLVKPRVKDTGMKPVRETANQEDIPSQIRKYKELMDDGIITQEEYEVKKKQLLNL